MSLDGHVLCQRMLIGPLCAIAAGAATVAAAPAAAAVRKRRREVCLSLFDLLIGFSPVSGRAHALAVNYCRQDKGLRVALATRLRDNATLRRSPDAPDINDRWPDLFRAGRNKFPRRSRVATSRVCGVRWTCRRRP